MKVGRNDLCPCRSGLKYKKCCFEMGEVEAIRHMQVEASNQKEDSISANALASRGKSNRVHSREEFDAMDFAHVITEGVVGDYGEPDLDAAFISQINNKKIDVYTIVWNMAKQPEISRKAQGITTLFIRRHKQEEKKIEKATSPEELVQIMLSGPDSMNHLALYDRLNETTMTSIDLIHAELTHPQSGAFVELATKYIYWSSYYPEDQLLALVTHPNNTAYGLSLLCMLLGMIEIEEAAKPLWDYYHFFREEYPDKNYWKGPLMGLSGLKHRRDHPIKISDSQAEQIAEMLQEFGVDISVAQAHRVGSLIVGRHVVRGLEILISTGKLPMEHIDSIFRKLLEILRRK